MLPENAIVQELLSHSTSIVEITGGEPLLEKATPSLCSILLEHGFTVLIETNGSIDISVLPAKCIRIIDVKCPGSGMEGSFLTDNIRHIVAQDELKYVLSSYDDFTWALDHVKQFDLQKKCTIIFSPNLNKISASDCAGWIIEGNVPVRLGVQLHKIIWGDKRGV
jgi:7-carboxy-7-deazaguanine synthase